MSQTTNMFSSVSPAKIVFLDRRTLPDFIEIKPFAFPHELQVFDATPPEAVRARIAQADIVVTNKVPITARDLDSASRLKLVAIAATGSDNVDLATCDARGISVCNVRDYASTTVPEHAFALIFALRRSLAGYRSAVINGRWFESGQFCFFDFPIRDLAGSTLGVIGDGVLGRATARIGEALGMRILMAAHKGRHDMGARYTGFDEVCEQADIITLHCPLLDATRNLIGQAEFSRMRRRPIIINTARGGLVDEVALVDALKRGLISGAGVDVVTREPLPPDHPFREIIDHHAFVLTPHVAWASAEAVQQLADQLVENISAYVNGTPRNLLPG